MIDNLDHSFNCASHDDKPCDCRLSIPERVNDDALGSSVNRATYDYMHRYDSPDNQRDSMG